MNTAPTKSGRGWVLAQSFLLLALVAAGPLGKDYDKVEGLIIEIGIVLFVVGAYLGVRGVRDLGRNRTPFPAPLADAELVMSGVYRWWRHPLYASLIYAGFGWALLWHSGPALFVAVMNALFFYAKARCEERHLLERFPQYAEYMRRTDYLIPGIW